MKKLLTVLLLSPALAEQLLSTTNSKITRVSAEDRTAKLAQSPTEWEDWIAEEQNGLKEVNSSPGPKETDDLHFFEEDVPLQVTQE